MCTELILDLLPLGFAQGLRGLHLMTYVMQEVSPSITWPTRWPSPPRLLMQGHPSHLAAGDYRMASVVLHLSKN